MYGNIFSLQNGKAIEISDAEYELESELQEIVAENPNLLVRPSDGDDYELLFLSREQALRADEAGTTYYLDVFLAGSDGVPVLVEVKRSSDARIYREVTAQMMDYAAHLSSLDVSSLSEGSTLPEEFWDSLSQNIAAGRVRLVFVADRIPPSLKTLIEFMDQNMTAIDVYGVELEKHKNGSSIILSRSFVEYNKKAAKRAFENNALEWTPEQISERVLSVAGPEADALIKEIVAYASASGFSIRYGAGPKLGNVMFYRSGKKMFNIGVGTTSKIKIEVAIPRIISVSNGSLSDQEIRDVFSSFPDGSVTMTQKYILPTIRSLSDPSCMDTFKRFMDSIAEASS